MIEKLLDFIQHNIKPSIGFLFLIVGLSALWVWKAEFVPEVEVNSTIALAIVGMIIIGGAIVIVWGFSAVVRKVSDSRELRRYEEQKHSGTLKNLEVLSLAEKRMLYTLLTSGKQRFDDPQERYLALYWKDITRKPNDYNRIYEIEGVIWNRRNKLLKQLGQETDQAK